MSQQEIESVGFGYAGLAAMTERYDPARLKDGWNDVGGEEVFFVSNPGLGLWAFADRVGAQG